MTTRKTTTPRRPASSAARTSASPPARRTGAVRRKKPAAPAPAAIDVAAIERAIAIETPRIVEADAAEQIRVRAYFLHLERRGRPADPVEDWLRAERELSTAAGV